MKARTSGPFVLGMLDEHLGHIRFDHRRRGSAERPCSRMNDERIVAENITVTRLARAHAEIVLLAVALAEYGVEEPDFPDYASPDEHAEADRGRQIGVERYRRAFHRTIGEARIIGRRIVDAKPRIGADLGIVRELA